MTQTPRRVCGVLLYVQIVNFLVTIKSYIITVVFHAQKQNCQRPFAENIKGISARQSFDRILYSQTENTNCTKYSIQTIEQSQTMQHI